MLASIKVVALFSQTGRVLAAARTNRSRAPAGHRGEHVPINAVRFLGCEEHCIPGCRLGQFRGRVVGDLSSAPRRGANRSDTVPLEALGPIPLVPSGDAVVSQVIEAVAPYDRLRENYTKAMV